MNGRCLVLGLMLTATAAAGANEPLALRVSPAFSFVPANFVIQTNVDPDGTMILHYALGTPLR